MKGEITDAKLMRTKDGKSRQLAFIGFRTEEEALAAIKYFNKSFLDTSRISCEIALKIGDSNAPRPWSKYSKGKLVKTDSSKSSKEDTEVKKPSKKQDIPDDPKLVEFLEVMQPRSKQKLWANDDQLTVQRDTKKFATKDVSDMDYLKSRITEKWSDSESETSVEEHEEPEDDGEVHDHEKLSDETELTNRIFIRNLPYTTIEEELEEFFTKFGEVSQIHIVVDKETKRSKGFAYVQFSTVESATRALKELDNTIFQGRLLHIMPAKLKEQTSTQKHELGEKSFKQKKEEERKASEASGNTKAWNTLFMRPDTVIENIARKHGISKSEFLDREGTDLAVRIALGETQVIAETKKALEASGINVKLLEEFAAGKNSGVKRSNHVLLVKNLPYGTSEIELKKMFAKFGNLDKLILPQTKTLALVAFLEPSEARAAFRGLAYKRYKDAPLYLEWAPADVISTCPVVGAREVKRVLVEQAVEHESEADPDRVESRSLFVKNLNFKTTDDGLKRHLQTHLNEGEIRSAKIKKHVKNGKSVSMGFGFVEFDSVETAAVVCRDLQGTVLDGYALTFQVCHVKNEEKGVKVDDKDKSSTKLLVRNVAFEATEKDIRQLFTPFGQIKSVRLPMKFGNHRGFAFVEFVTKQEAQNALQALSSTHLYGRHLVIERAKEGESLEDLRAKVTAQFYNTNTKKRKDLVDSEEANFKAPKFS